ncbi:hypothetical protein NE172_06925 [Clostridium botulinum]|uniref:Uncharacterized protein n=1 Tax=Clostridium botulinum TaxID=1491 RepID=A0A6B4JKN4_CLOBO|nr:hypothetical protein [Clostridium botulinum]EES49802.1 hypothetical protein CLO_2418 [Clostridium botulinum E1 str. 'BoNT E Beluga']MBY6760897.1 hypothetical protein [Clostridium botulinum]MBY6919811.1 hypothetical protein [Clostridium botulinum]MCR1130684.1 hypothetical protein [Clostridium botulinum]NFJ57584.1 hypothetical protein [Clostridium botulinum]
MILANSKFSEIIQGFITNEINAILNKYNNIELEKIQKVEALISKINDADFKQQLLQDFDMTFNLATDIDDNYVDNNVIKMLLWIKNNTSLDIIVSKPIKIVDEVNEYGYASINDNTIIYKKNTDLRDFAKDKLEYMLEDEFYIDKLFTKEVLIEMWRDGTTRSDAISELIQGIEVEELLDMDIQTMFEDDNNQEYIYAVLDC